MKIFLGIFLAIILLCLVPLTIFADSLDNVKVWYLGHCGYAVKTADHLLIFDYIEYSAQPAERSLDLGYIDPEEIKDLKVRVFVSHSHSDHWDKIILGWQSIVKDIQYFYGWQIEERPGHIALPAPRAKFESDDLKIYTVNSHHSGVPEAAFMVLVDGLTIFHPGDYQGRMISRGVTNVVDDMRYLKQFSDSVDILFMYIDLQDFNKQIIRDLKPPVIFPMHAAPQQEHVYIEFAEKVKAFESSQKIEAPQRRGESYIVKGKN